MVAAYQIERDSRSGGERRSVRPRGLDRPCEGSRRPGM